MKYKVGNKVRVRENLVVDKFYGDYEFINEMNCYKGKETIISEICFDDCYKLDMTNNYNWTDEMLESIDTKPNSKSDYDKEYISVEYAAGLEAGDTFECLDDGSHWMIYLPIITETAYLRSEIIRCRYTLNVDGEKYWVYFQGPTETDLRWFIKNQINVNELNLSGTIYIKNDEKTKKFFKRFTHLKLDGHVWEVQVTDAISVPGILELEIQEYYDNSIAEECDVCVYADGTILSPEWPYLCAKVYVSIKWIDENKTTYTRIFPSAVGFMSYKTKGSMEDDLKQKENMSTMEMREHLKISRAEFSRRYNIPIRTLENWESGKSKCPDYVRQLLERAVLEDCEVK